MMSSTMFRAVTPAALLLSAVLAMPAAHAWQDTPAAPGQAETGSGSAVSPAAPASSHAPESSQLPAGTPEAQQIVVNGAALSAQQSADLSRMLGQVVAPGRYWYDPTSGLWGFEGGPAAGQLPPGLPPITAPLEADASGGLTSVFINGRAIHPIEVQQLYMLLGQVIPGRYIMNAQWKVALEGGSFAFPLVDLAAVAASAQRQSAMRWFGARDTGNSVYLPEFGGRSGGLSVGQASDGCTYVVSGDYSTEVCN